MYMYINVLIRKILHTLHFDGGILIKFIQFPVLLLKVVTCLLVNNFASHSNNILSGIDLKIFLYSENGYYKTTFLYMTNSLVAGHHNNTYTFPYTQVHVSW